MDRDGEMNDHQWSVFKTHLIFYFFGSLLDEQWITMKFDMHY